MSQDSRRSRGARVSLVSGTAFVAPSPLEVAQQSQMSRHPNPRNEVSEVIDLVSDDDEGSGLPAVGSGKPSYREVGGFVVFSESPSPPSRHGTPRQARISSRINNAPQPAVATKAEQLGAAAAQVESVAGAQRPLPMNLGPHIKESPRAAELARKRISRSTASPRTRSPKSLEPSRRRTPKPLDARTSTTPQDARRAGSSLARAPTPLAESESDDSEVQDVARELRAFRRTPSKSSFRKPSGPASQASSMSSDTPLIPRLKEKRQKSRLARGNSAGQEDQAAPEMSPHMPPTEDLVRLLQGFKEAMEEDHRTVTYWKLHDAKLAIEEAPPSEFDEKTDPFASLTSVFKPQDEPLAEGSVQERADPWTFNKAGKGTKSRPIYLAAVTFKDNIARVPSYQSHTNVRRNILSADDENLKYIPYLGDQPKDDNHDQLVQELEEQFVRTRAEDIQDFEKATKLRVWLTTWLEALDIDLTQQTLKHYVLSMPGIEDRLRIKKAEVTLLQTYDSSPLDSAKIAMCARFYKAFEDVFDIQLEKVVLPKDQLKEMLETAALKSMRPSPHKLKAEVSHRLGTYLELTCLICGVVDCPTHGEFEDKDGSDQDSEEESSPRFQASRQKVVKKEHEQFSQRQHSDLALPYPDTLTRFLSQKLTRPAEEPLRNTGPCSTECYMNGQYPETAFSLDQSAIDAIPDMLISLTDSTYQSCHIAFSLGVPCWQVYTEVVKGLEENSNAPQLEPAPVARIKRPDWYDNKKRTLKSDWKDLTSAHLHQTRLNSNSCGHDGPCTNLCPCASRNILCERFCGCGDDCPRRFTGCSCHANGLNCVSEHCICIAMNRECGPECTSCGAIDRINPLNKHHNALFATGCQNISLQRGVFKKLAMGESQLEGTGFGVYLLEAVRKGDFLSEYTGEVISHAEADRRGIIYDRKLMSFLFDLNASYVIDAAKMGNKTRFINHASIEKEGLNCEAKIVLVNGEHRIKFIALREINVGEELLFNYGHKFAEKHGLTVKLPSAKEGNKGVLVGEEALDALDGVTARTKIARGQMKAVRGRSSSSGRGGRKAATKSAPKPKAVAKKPRKIDEEVEVEVETTSQEVFSQDLPIAEDDEDDEDFYGSTIEEEDEAGSESVEGDDQQPKLRRQVRKPARWR